MKILTVLVAVVAVLGHMVVPAQAEMLFNKTTMLGWQKKASGSAMAYVSVPTHSTRAGDAQPRVGLMITGPSVSAVGRQAQRLHGPRVLDFGLTGRGINRPWTASLNVGRATAWANNPDALPRGTKTHLMDSGLSWVAVGLISAGIVAGVLIMVEEDAPASTEATN